MRMTPTHKPKHQIGTFNNWTIANYPILSFHEEQPTIELIYGTVGYSHTYLQDYCEPTKKNPFIKRLMLKKYIQDVGW